MKGGGHGEGHGHDESGAQGRSGARDSEAGSAGKDHKGGFTTRGDEAEHAKAFDASPISRAAAEAYSPGLANRAARKEARVEELATQSFTSQIPGRKEVNVPINNNDCGPASVTTAMKALGVIAKRGNYEAEISRTREEMTGAENHMQGTSIGQVESAARANGLKATTISGLKAIDKALQHHEVVIAGGMPTHVVAGTNFQGNQTNKVDSIGHFVTVLGVDRVTKTYTVDNSEKKGPTEVSRAQLRALVTKVDGTGFNNSVAISRH